MPDGIQILGVYTHVTDCEEEDGENKAQLQISVAYFCSIGLYFLV